MDRWPSLPRLRPAQIRGVADETRTKEWHLGSRRLVARHQP
jgi:hypothetical protein